jgi:hypothetical protein
LREAAGISCAGVSTGAGTGESEWGMSFLSADRQER